MFPYDVFLSGATIGPDTDDEENHEVIDDSKADNGIIEILSSDVIAKEVKDEADSKCSDDSLIEPKQLRPSPRRIARRQVSQSQHRFQPIRRPTRMPIQNKELKKLQVYGAGPKMPGFSSSEDEHRDSLKDQPSKVLNRCRNEIALTLICISNTDLRTMRR